VFITSCMIVGWLLNFTGSFLKQCTVVSYSLLYSFFILVTQLKKKPSNGAVTNKVDPVTPGPKISKYSDPQNKNH